MHILYKNEFILDSNYKLFTDTVVVCFTFKLRGSVYTNGYSLKIICYEFLTANNAAIDASSVDLLNVDQRNGKDGKDSDNFRLTGGNGEDAKVGLPAANISVYTVEATGNLILKALGAPGANGGKGGDGANALDRQDGYPCSYFTDCSEINRGHTGGDSGKPGAGSNGSKGGDIVFYSLFDKDFNLDAPKSYGGLAGKNGEPGKPGIGGVGARYYVMSQFDGIDP